MAPCPEREFFKDINVADPLPGGGQPESGIWMLGNVFSSLFLAFRAEDLMV